MAGRSCWGRGGVGGASFEGLGEAGRLPGWGPSELRAPRATAPGSQLPCLRLSLSLLSLGPSAPVLSIHKLPASGAADISFPMKGWRATGDWAKVPEDRVTVSRSVFSTGLAGKEPQAAGGALRGDSGPGSEGTPPRSFLLESGLLPQGPRAAFTSP